MKQYKEEQLQMSEAFINTAFLTLSGGLQDAYTYNVRDHVFSNAQTGNVVLMSQYIMSGQWDYILRYLFPILSFALGVWFAQIIHRRFHNTVRMHWRQAILLFEILILFMVGFIPQPLNMLATSLVSFTCAMQVQAFRTVNGYSYASTMCIGNLRSGTEALSEYVRTHRKEDRKKALYYFGVIFFFALGAGIGGNLSLRYGFKVIWVSCGLLLISFTLMFFERFRYHDHLL